MSNPVTVSYTHLIIILSVASELTPHQFQSTDDIDKLNQSFLDEAQFNVDKMKAKFDPNLKVTTKVLVGFPAETIVKVAEEEDVGLIAISSSGKGRVDVYKRQACFRLYSS